MQAETFHYDNRIVKNFAFATILWGAVGMLVGLLAAVQMYCWPDILPVKNMLN